MAATLMVNYSIVIVCGLAVYYCSNLAEGSLALQGAGLTMGKLKLEQPDVKLARGLPVAKLAMPNLGHTAKWANKALGDFQTNLNQMLNQNKARGAAGSAPVPVEKQPAVQNFEYHDFLEDFGDMLTADQRRDYDENGSCMILQFNHVLCRTCCEDKGQMAIQGEKDVCRCVFDMSAHTKPDKEMFGMNLLKMKF